MPKITDSLSQAIDDASYVDVPEEEREALQAEHNAVKKLWQEYDQARKFDKDARAQYAMDRRYAAGTADTTWAVTTNLIGSFVDILVSFLYARNPDVSVRRAPQAVPSASIGNAKMQEDFARTLELVISRLWKQGRLKATARKQVRSTLATGPGWFKAIMVAEAPDMPEVQGQLNDLRDNIAKLEALQNSQSYDAQSQEQDDARKAQMQELMASLEQKIEVAIRKYLAVDFVSSEDMQVSLDVRSIEDHLDASWNANAIYRPKSSLKEMFPRLTDDDCRSAKCYYQKRIKHFTPIGEGQVVGDAYGGGGVNAEEAEQFTSGGTGYGTGENSEDGVEFAKVIELWDKRTNHVKTMIEGVKRWAKEPYQPPYPCSRFYPYFLLTFYDVDGARHPQSLSWRLHKLYNEYCRSRSNFRLTRERAIPATLFNAAGMSPQDIDKIQKSTQQEFVGITPTNPDTPLQNLFAPKPVEKIDPRMYDNTYILMDMEKIAGVQEALQTSSVTPKTATEAEIQQSGFASRTTADRDKLESVLSELAQYTAEVALTALSRRDVQRIAGAGAYWPEGMALEDLLTLVEVDIEAGTTGKPRAKGDQNAWGVILPQLKEAQMQIQQARLMGNHPLADAMIELLRETMLRMGDDTDIDRFIPQSPTQTPGAIPGAVPPPGADPLLPPAGEAGGAAPNLLPPALDAPALDQPTI